MEKKISLVKTGKDYHKSNYTKKKPNLYSMVHVLSPLKPLHTTPLKTVQSNIKNVRLVHILPSNHELDTVTEAVSQPPSLTAPNLNSLEKVKQTNTKTIYKFFDLPMETNYSQKNVIKSTSQNSQNMKTNYNSFLK